MDAASAVTSVALVAGLGVVVALVASSGPSGGRPVEEYRFLDIGSHGQSVLAVSDSNFIVDSSGSQHMVRPTDGAALTALYTGGSSAASVWDDATQSFLVIQGTEVIKYAKPDWEQLKVIVSRPAPHVREFIGGDTIGSIAVSGPVLFVGTYSGQVFRDEGSDVVEQKVRGGPVTMLAVLDDLLLAVVEDIDDEGKASLYLLKAYDLSVVSSREWGKVDQLVALGEGRFLVADAKGLWIAQTSKDSLTLKLEVEGAVRVSNNTSDGYFVLSTKSATSLMRLMDGKLTTVKDLARGEMVDAAINDEYIAVLLSSDPRGLTIYRLE